MRSSTKSSKAINGFRFGLGLFLNSLNRNHVRHSIKYRARSLAFIAAVAFIIGGAGASNAQTIKNGGQREVTVLHMADTHAALEAHPEIFFDAEGKPFFREAGGFALLAAAIKSEREKAAGDAMLVNVGDTIHGAAVAEWTQGAGIVPIVNRLGIDVFVPGNWEFAYGPDAFRKRMSELNHPVSAINLFDAKTGQRMFPASVVKNVNGVRVGVIGITSVIVDKSMAPDFSKGLRFTFKEDVQTEVDRLRKDGVEIVLLATELGLAQETRLAREIKNADFILGGHTHERTERPIVEAGGIPVIQSGSEGSFLSRLTFQVRGGRVIGYRHKLLEVTAENYRPDKKIKRLVAEIRRPFARRLDETVGRTDTDLFRKGVLESSMDNFISDAVREATGADIAMANGFRFSYPVTRGAITEESLFNIFPMEANIKIGTLTGKQLRDFWENSLEDVFAADAYGQRGGWGARPSGMTVRVRLGAPKGNRIVWMKVGDELVKDDRLYTVASCDRPGDAAETLCRFEGATGSRTLSITVHDAMRAFLRRHKTIRPTVEGRVSAEDAAGRVWSQFELGKAAKD
jgi:S-sulfosulfanyl-L-cysteine sulfohydrolase